MSISHHPSEPLLLAYAGGTLDAGEQLALATHLLNCGGCRAFADAMESAGGALLSDLPAAEMASDALSRLTAQIALPEPAKVAIASPIRALAHVEGLPSYARSLPAAPWRWVAPGVHIQRLTHPAGSATRVFLLKAKAGLKFRAHTHEDVELTCVLKGSFSHDGRNFIAGDFDHGTDDDDHDIAIGAESECICLVAMRGKLQFRGLIGRLVQPLIAI